MKEKSFNKKNRTLFFRRFVYIFFIIIIIPFYLFAQNNPDIKFDRITSENFKVEKGLSQNSANCILQDSKGYMWVGTWDGLNRFDGYSFMTFKSSIKGNSNELSNQTINALFEDKSGTIWVGTETGLNSYDRRSQKFTQYKKDACNPFSISSDTIWCIAEENENILWIGTNNGLNKLDKRTGYFYHFKLNPNNANSPSNNNINCILPDAAGNIWFGSNEGLNYFNTKERIFSHWYYNPDNKNTISDDLVWSILYDEEGNLWICTDGGLDVYSFITKKFTHYYHDDNDYFSLSNNHVTSIMQDNERNFWIGTYGGGLNKFDKKNNNFTHFFNDIYNSRSLSNDYIKSIYQDKSGIIWIATAWKGVSKIDKYSNRFKHFQHLSNDENSLNNNNVWSIFQDNIGKIWLATDEGINIYDTTTRKFSFLKNNPNNSNSIPSNLTRLVFQDSKGVYWIGTFDAGICRYNQTTKTFTRFTNNLSNPQSLSYNRINFVLEDHNKNIWIGTDNGLNLYLPKKNSFRRFFNDPLDKTSISNNVVYYMYEDKEGYIWLCTLGGLNRYDPSSGHFSCYKKDDSKYNTLSSDKIFSMYEDKEGIFWITTCGGGLNRFNRKTGEIKYFLEENGLSNNVTYNIFEDNNSCLWITTNYGLSCFNKTNETFINYDVKDGIQSNEFNLNAAFHNLQNDEMFFGGMNGFNSFYPEKIAKNEFVPPIIISGFKIFDKLKPIEISDGDTILLSYDDNFFSFEFAALDFSNPQKNKYAFKLKNFDNNWNYCDAYKRFAGYTRVPPGAYEFKIKGSNSDGIWNEKGITITIIIKPPWWRTWWFRIGSALFISFLGWFIIYNRLRNIRIKHDDEKRILEIEKQMFSLEQTALRLQMNPHFIFNSLNSIQSFVIANDTDKAIHYLAKFSQLMRFILSHSQQTFVPVSDEIKSMSIYLDIERLRFDNKFSYEFDIDENIDIEFIEIPPMIIQPYIENAIIHGILNKEGNGFIKIILKLMNEKYILCTVQDDGIGREKALEIKKRSDLKHKSRGMLITQKRLDILNERDKDLVNITITDLKDSYNNAKGTKVEIVIIYKDN
ncbi:MAG: two-component regulator propeller domain-containing protein [Bacteroidota bacterium]